MSTGLNKTKLLIAAALIGPSVLVEAGHRLNIPAGPAISQAGTDPTAVTPIASNPMKLNDEQELALQRGVELADHLFSGNPLFYPNVESTGSDESEPAQMIDASSLEATVSSIAKGGDGRMFAVINGKIRMEGDLVKDDWTLTNINAQARTISIENSEGKKFVIDLDR